MVPIWTIVATFDGSVAIGTDLESEDGPASAVQRTVEAFGGIDILVNNASAIWLRGTLDTPMKRFDLMHEVNARGTFLCTQACLPHLLDADNPHVLTLSPPLNLDPRWFKDHVAYTISKYGMSLCVLGFAGEFRSRGIAEDRIEIATAGEERPAAPNASSEEQHQQNRRDEFEIIAGGPTFRMP